MLNGQVVFALLLASALAVILITLILAAALDPTNGYSPAFSKPMIELTSS
jgi:hypothetical protein